MTLLHSYADSKQKSSNITQMQLFATQGTGSMIVHTVNGFIF